MSNFTSHAKLDHSSALGGYSQPKPKANPCSVAGRRARSAWSGTLASATRRLAGAGLGLVLGLGVVGCGQNQDRSKAQFDDAMSMLKNVNRGYVPASAKDYDAQQAKNSLAVNEQVHPAMYQQKKLDQVLTKLQPVAKDQDSPRRGPALRMIGQIKLAKARALRRRAGDAAADVIRHTSALRRLSNQAVSDQQRTQTFSTNNQKLSSSYDKELAKARSASEKLQKQIKQKSAQREDEQTKAKKQHQLSKTKSAQAQKWAGKAFTAHGDKAYELQNKQAKARRAAAAASFQAEAHQSKVDALDVALAPLESKNKSLQQAIKKLEQAKAATQKRMSSNKQKRSASQSERDEATKQLTSQYQKLADQFKNRVQGQYDAALKQTDGAIDDLNQAQKAAQGPVREAINTGLLTARTEKLAVLSRYVSALTGQAQVLKALVGDLKQAGTLGENSPLAQGLSQLQAKRQELVKTSKQALDQARSAANDVGQNESKPWASVIGGYASQLKS